MDTESASLIAWSFGVAAGAYGLLVAFLLSFGREWHATRRARMMLLAVSLSAIWASLSFLAATGSYPVLTLSASLTNIFRYGAWYGFLTLLLIPNAGTFAKQGFAPGVADTRMLDDGYWRRGFATIAGFWLAICGAVA